MELRIQGDADLGGGRLDGLPGPESTYRFRPEFGQRFMLFIDTEEEFDWSQPTARSSVATSAMTALPQAHSRLAAYGAKPVYLFDYPAISSPNCTDVMGPLLASGGASAGAHLHPWVNPPYDEIMNESNSFAGNLPIELERAKLHILTQKIEQTLGVRPLCYRSGRYGVGPATAMLLEEAGYRVDVSVRSHFDYSATGGPNFAGYPITPYRAGPKGGLLEIPLTAAFLGRWRQNGANIYARTSRIPLAHGALARAGLLNRIALTPEGMPVQEAMEAVRILQGEGLQLFSLSCHSPSFAIGHTPYVRDKADLRRFYEWWDRILGLLISLGVTGVGLDEVLADLDAQDRGLR
ncbi:polysaccharide deacetylase family protein [Aquisediminimonas sediminicola]|uniref:polysaccharide deacetylase family protein n=1 Tax=Alteraquisediminimonas sediminicola TaxID=2676787 RepID=UPI001C8D1AD6|nr:polysaccharide deacetylase family protein [Aquisediminimonas sediminicola]